MQSVKCVAVTQPKLSKNGTEIKYFILSDPYACDDEEPQEFPENQMSVEEFLAYVARVSNPSNQNNTLTAPKLLKYLIKNKHYSPFEMVNMVMEINTTRDIGRQILRHRSFSFQEFSQRYADPTKMEFVTRQARLQDQKNRQNSIETDDYVLEDKWRARQEHLIAHAQDSYEWAIQNGIAKEQARVLLPEGLTPTRMYMNGSLRSWLTYCDLRMKPSTQKEHREIATMAWGEVLKDFPSLKELVIGQE